MRACRGSSPDVIAYLLERGADMKVRRVVDGDTESSETGTNAFEFAAGSGCVECIGQLIEHGKRARIEVTQLANRMSLAAAAQSGNLDMLNLVLELGQYPRQDANGTWIPEITTITE